MWKLFWSKQILKQTNDHWFKISDRKILRQQQNNKPITK